MLLISLITVFLCNLWISQQTFIKFNPVFKASFIFGHLGAVDQVVNKRATSWWLQTIRVMLASFSVDDKSCTLGPFTPNSLSVEFSLAWTENYRCETYHRLSGTKQPNLRLTKSWIKLNQGLVCFQCQNTLGWFGILDQWQEEEKGAVISTKRKEMSHGSRGRSCKVLQCAHISYLNQNYKDKIYAV